MSNKLGQWFPHEKHMRNDGAIKLIRAEFGGNGYLTYCMLLEVLTDESDFVLELTEKQYRILSVDFGINLDELKKIIDSLIENDLFILENGFLKSEGLIERFEKLIKKSGKMSSIAKGRKRDKKGYFIQEKPSGLDGGTTNSEAENHTIQNNTVQYKRIDINEFNPVDEFDEHFKKQDELDPDNTLYHLMINSGKCITPEIANDVFKIKDVTKKDIETAFEKFLPSKYKRRGIITFVQNAVNDRVNDRTEAKRQNDNIAKLERVMANINGISLEINGLEWDNLNRLRNSNEKEFEEYKKQLLKEKG